MFSENAKTFIEGAIDAETNAAISKWGNTYNSLHEGYAVLKEEVDEVRDEQIHIKNKLYKIWDNVRTNDITECKSNVEALREHAEKLALEAVQVCAVCEKILKTI